MDIDAKAHIARRMIDHGAYMAVPGLDVTGALAAQDHFLLNLFSGWLFTIHEPSALASRAAAA
jgi:hypothetical protein